MSSWKYLRALNARCCCLRKSSSSKACPDSVAPSEFSSADAKIHATQLPRLSFLVCIEPIAETRTSRRELEFHAPPSRAISVPYIVHIPRPGIGTNCCSSCTAPSSIANRQPVHHQLCHSNSVAICIHRRALRVSTFTSPGVPEHPSG